MLRRYNYPLFAPPQPNTRIAQKYILLHSFDIDEVSIPTPTVASIAPPENRKMRDYRREKKTCFAIFRQCYLVVLRCSCRVGLLMQISMIRREIKQDGVGMCG